MNGGKDTMHDTFAETPAAGARRALPPVARFFVVSTVSTLIDYGVLWLLARSLPPSPLREHAAVSLGYAVGTAINFAWARRWVFPPSPLPFARELLSVAAVGGIGLLLTDVITVALHRGITLARHGDADWQLLAAKTAAVAGVFCWNFLARRLWVYRPSGG